MSDTVKNTYTSVSAWSPRIEISIESTPTNWVSFELTDAQARKLQRSLQQQRRLMRELSRARDAVFAAHYERGGD